MTAFDEILKNYKKNCGEQGDQDKFKSLQSDVNFDEY